MSGILEDAKELAEMAEEERLKRQVRELAHLLCELADLISDMDDIGAAYQDARDIRHSALNLSKEI